MPTSGTISGTLTAGQIISGAFQDIAVYSAGEEPSAEDAEMALDRLNFMLKSWQARGVNLWRDTQGTVTFPAATATVTLDPRCIDVMEARLIQTNTFQRPLQRWEAGEYRQIPNKATPGWPTAFYLDKQRDAVTMTLWPVPNIEMDVIYSYARVIEDVSDVTQEVDVPQQWLETVRANLAVLLAGPTGARRLDPQTVAAVEQRAAMLEQMMLDSDRPASVFMGPVYGRGF